VPEVVENVNVASVLPLSQHCTRASTAPFVAGVMLISLVVLDALFSNETGATSSGVVVSMLLNAAHPAIIELPLLVVNETVVSDPSATLYRAKRSALSADECSSASGVQPAEYDLSVSFASVMAHASKNSPAAGAIETLIVPLVMVLFVQAVR